ncbi:RNase H domain-containing protein [Trichonephila clavipes]|nr:RNase H domain-containing protein [Trichonephila clavipes]
MMPTSLYLKEISPSSHYRHYNIKAQRIVSAASPVSVDDGIHQGMIGIVNAKLHSNYTNIKQSTVPPAHHWYEAKPLGGSLFLQCSRMEQSILTHFQSGHLRTLTFRDGNKFFPTCVRCSA